MDVDARSHWPLTLTNGCASALNALVPLALVRILAPEELGRYKVFFLYMLLSPGLFLTGGFINGIYHWSGKLPAAKPELRQSWTWCLGISLACSAAGLLLAGPLARWTGAAGPDLRAFMLAMPFAMAAMFFEDLLIARGEIWSGSWYSAGSGALRTAAVLWAAWRWRRVEPVFLAFAGVSALRALAGWLLLSGSGDVAPLFSRQESSKVLRYAVPVSLASFAGLGLTRIDQVVLSLRLSAAQFAFYSMGCLAVPPLEIFETSVNRVLIPRMSRAFEAGDTAEAASSYSGAVSELWRWLLPASAGLALFADPIVRLLFTERYAPAARYLRLFAFSYLLAAVPFNSVARARGDGGWILGTTLLFALLSSLAVLAAAARWGAMGALAGMLAAALLLRVHSLRYARRCLGLPYARFFPGRALMTQAGVTLAAAAAALALRPLAPDPRAWLLSAGPAFAAVYLGATYALSTR